MKLHEFISYNAVNSFYVVEVEENQEKEPNDEGDDQEEEDEEDDNKDDNIEENLDAYEALDLVSILLFLYSRISFKY